MKILLSDGSGLTSRQTANRLRAAGHTVGVASSDPIGLTRFTRSVRHWHEVPPFGAEPFRWLDAAVGIARHHGYDVLLPTQEQVTVLSWAREAGQLDGLACPVPSFASLVAVQDKVAARATLQRLDVPQPPAVVVSDLRSPAAEALLPAYAKTPIGTATSGVARVETAADLAGLAERWTADAHGDGWLVQSAVDGPLAMLQAVFDHGRMVAFHASLRVAEGARGGASHKRSLAHDDLRLAIERLGRGLDWHGALSADAILTSDGCTIIDVNPRLVEPGNAWCAGVDLVGALLDVACDRGPAVQAPGVPDVATHQLLLAVLGAAQHERRRRAVLRVLRRAALHSGEFADSSEELTPIAHDWRAGVPLVAAVGATLASPSTWRRFASGSVASYAITPEGWAAICARAAHEL